MMSTLVRELIQAGALRVEDGNHGENRPRKEEFGSGPLKFIRAVDLVDGVVDFAGAALIDDVASARVRKGLGLDGDSILSHKGTVGKVAYVPVGSPEFVCSPQTTFWRSLNAKVVDARFLNFALRSPLFQSQLAAISSESDMAPYVSLTQQKRLRVPLPAIGNQRAIGEVLGALDDKIAANRRVIETSVTLATQIVAREAVGPDLPLSEIADVQMGSSPRGAELNLDADGMEFFQGVRDFGELSPTPRVFATVTPRRAKAGDTLLAVRAPVGEVNWARNETCIGRGLAAVRSTDTPATIHYLLRRFTGRWDEHEGSGTVFSSVTGPQVKAMQFPTVPEASADEVEQLLLGIHQRALNAEGESEVLARTRDELLPLLMSGRITVEDAEHAAEDVL